MKKLLIILFVLPLGSCKEDDTINLEAEIVSRVGSISNVMDHTFIKTTGELSYNRIKELKKAASNKSVFISSMNSIINDLFESEIKKARSSLQLGTSNFTSADLSTIVLNRLTSITNGTSLLFTAYEQTVRDSIQVYLNKNSGKDLIVIKSYSLNPTLLPKESFSLNATQLNNLANKNGITDIIVSGGSGSLEEAVEKFRTNNQIPLIATALLLPAIQKYNDSSNQESDYVLWLQSLFGTTANNTLLNRIYAAGYLASLHYIINSSYVNTDENDAAIGLFRERYKAMMMFIFEETWNNRSI